MDEDTKNMSASEILTAESTGYEHSLIFRSPMSNHEDYMRGWNKGKFEQTASAIAKEGGEG